MAVSRCNIVITCNAYFNIMAVPCTNNSLGSVVDPMSHVHGLDGKSAKAVFESRLTIDEIGVVVIESMDGASHESCAIAVDGGDPDSSEMEKETKSLAASGKQAGPESSSYTFFKKIETKLQNVRRPILLSR